MARLVLLERDGVLTEVPPDPVAGPGRLALLPGAAQAVARLNAAGWRTALVTDQPEVGRGMMPPEMLERIHERLREELARGRAQLDAIFVCTEPPWSPSEQRKPRPGLLREAMLRFGAEPPATPMIGDSLDDLEAAAAAGCRRVLLRTGTGRATQAAGIPDRLLPVAVHADLGAAVEALLGEAR